MDQWLNYHHLYYFRTIAAEGSIARAAQKLRLGQPTLSTQLKSFEEKLGFRLFERQHRKLILTEAGQVAYRYATEIFQMGSEMIEALHDRLTPTRTHVQLGALDSIPKQLIYRLVEAAYSSGPCSVSVLEGKDDELTRELLAHRIDLLLTDHRPKTQGNGAQKFFFRHLADLPVVVCGAPRFKALKKNFPKSLNHQPFVLPTSHSKLRLDFDHFCELNQIHPDIVAETQDTSLQKTLGIQGMGLIPIAKIALESVIDRNSMIVIGELPGIREELYLASASRRIENPISASLMKSFKL